MVRRALHERTQDAQRLEEAAARPRHQGAIPIEPQRRVGPIAQREELGGEGRVGGRDRRGGRCDDPERLLDHPVALFAHLGPEPAQAPRREASRRGEEEDREGGAQPGFVGAEPRHPRRTDRHAAAEERRERPEHRERRHVQHDQQRASHREASRRAELHRAEHVAGEAGDRHRALAQGRPALTTPGRRVGAGRPDRGRRGEGEPVERRAGRRGVQEPAEAGPRHQGAPRTQRHAQHRGRIGTDQQHLVRARRAPQRNHHRRIGRGETPDQRGQAIARQVERVELEREPGRAIGSPHAQRDGRGPAAGPERRRAPERVQLGGARRHRLAPERVTPRAQAVAHWSVRDVAKARQVAARGLESPLDVGAPGQERGRAAGDQRDAHDRRAAIGRPGHQDERREPEQGVPVGPSVSRVPHPHAHRRRDDRERRSQQRRAPPRGLRGAPQ